MAETENFEEYIKNLDEFAKSALVETFNIGASHAATALSQMTGKEVNISVPNLRIVAIKHVPEIVGEDVKVAVYIELGKDFSSHAFFIADYDDALKMFDIIMGNPPGTTKEMDEMVKSSFMEMGNILISAFANALSEFLGITIEQSPPSLAIDFLPAILDFALADIGKYCDYTIILETKITISGVEFEEHFLLFPKPEDMKKILEKLMGGLA
ncbi:chemotaxis protein CheC [Thermococcus chitonophagus]|uniref:Chemotaxis protein CheC n=1 Tax=Thermococcus chitonophagus TaxID=54262 RepID=A0A170SER8_9EURY|nr:chemotaxis protein CheC [Thermococcus chitonophagus]ASJ16092.1 chemotaxis protein CheC [Thermococcus chitonophagus]CUX77344.1 Chemotaxis protein CheC--inhibitor of MCP methylation [Thermococcus chitonophagus]